MVSSSARRAPGRREWLKARPSSTCGRKATAREGASGVRERPRDVTSRAQSETVSACATVSAVGWLSRSGAGGAAGGPSAGILHATALRTKGPKFGARSRESAGARPATGPVRSQVPKASRMLSAVIPGTEARRRSRAPGERAATSRPTRDSSSARRGLSGSRMLGISRPSSVTRADSASRRSASADRRSGSLR